MTAIVDASVVIKWVVRESNTEAALSLLDLAPVAPDLLRAELANVLATKVRKNEIMPEQALAAQSTSEAALTFLPSMVLAPRALEMALELGHAAYDCFYLALAEALDGTVVTADLRFLRRCSETRYRGLVRAIG